MSRVRIYVAGHQGMVGSALVRRLSGHQLILRSRNELDLRNQRAVVTFLNQERPTHIYMAAAKVGGITANVEFPAQFLHDNLRIASNIVEGAYLSGVEKLLMLGSSCIYPKGASIPISEDALLSGPLEPTNRPYALAKIAAIELCETYRREYGCNFISLMPCNLYGVGDRYDSTSHVIPAMIQKFHRAKAEKLPCVELLGTGDPMREFLYVDDLADACVICMDHYNAAGPINVGSDTEIAIVDLARLIASVVGYGGQLRWTGYYDGVMRKRIDSSKIRALGWTPRTGLELGIRRVYEDYLCSLKTSTRI